MPTRPPSPSSRPPRRDPLATRRRLLERLRRRGYDLLDEPVRIAGQQFAFTRVRDPERVLDAVIAAERRGGDGSRMPYWAELWESALGVAEWLSARPGLVTGRRTLDLGCGMGFAGMVAARLGAAELTLADIERDALLFAAANTLPHAAGRVFARRLDWSRDRLAGWFDLLIGADVLYERAQWDFLEPFWRQHLAPDGRVILGEPGRQTGAAFPDWITPRGWAIQNDRIRLEDRGKTISVFTLSRNG